jgi:hypothetical protein
VDSSRRTGCRRRRKKRGLMELEPVQEEPSQQILAYDPTHVDSSRRARWGRKRKRGLMEPEPAQEEPSQQIPAPTCVFDFGAV